MTPSKALVAAAAQFRKCICLTFGIVAIVQEICKYLSFLITLVGPELEEKNTIKSHKPLIDNLRRKNNFKVVVLLCSVMCSISVVMLWWQQNAEVLLLLLPYALVS